MEARQIETDVEAVEPVFDSFFRKAYFDNRFTSRYFSIDTALFRADTSFVFLQ